MGRSTCKPLSLSSLSLGRPSLSLPLSVFVFFFFSGQQFAEHGGEEGANVLLRNAPFGEILISILKVCVGYLLLLLSLSIFTIRFLFFLLHFSIPFKVPILKILPNLNLLKFHFTSSQFKSPTFYVYFYL